MEDSETGRPSETRSTVIKEASARIGWQMDRLSETLDRYTTPGYRFQNLRPRETPKENLLPHVMQIGENLNQRDPIPAPFPRLAELPQLMEAATLDVPVDEPEDAISIKLLDGYTKYLAMHLGQMFPDTVQEEDIAKGFREILAVDYPNTDLFIAVKDSISEDAGFEPELVQRVAAMDKASLKRNRPEVKNPQYGRFEEPTIEATLKRLPRLMNQQELDPALIAEIQEYARVRIVERGFGELALVHWFGDKVLDIRLAGRYITRLNYDSYSENNGFLYDENLNKVGDSYILLKDGGRYGDEQLIITFIKDDPRKKPPFGKTLSEEIGTERLEKIPMAPTYGSTPAVQLALNHLYPLPDEESMLMWFAPPAEGIEDNRTQDQKDVFAFAKTIATASSASQQPEELSRFIGLYIQSQQSEIEIQRERLREVRLELHDHDDPEESDN